MSTITTQDLERDQALILARVAAGEHILISRDGQPVAELRPVVLRPYGLDAGLFTVPDDFDAPLPESVLRGFEGR